MKRQLFLQLAIAILVLQALPSFGQNIGVNNPAPAASALLDLTSTNKGFLAPRMTTAQRLLIPAPANGLLVYDLSIGQFFYFDGIVWKAMGDGSTGWLTTGNAGTSPIVNFIGTIDGANLAFRVDNVHAGIIEEGMTGSTKFGFRSGNNGLSNAFSANVMIGAGSGESLSGEENVIIGNEAAKTITFGQNNTIIGYKANLSGSNVSNATIVGSEAGSINNSDEVTFYGAESGRNNGSSLSNSYFGFQSGRDVSGNNNAAFGDKVLLQSNLSNRNAGFGSEALSDLNTGDDNAAFGYHSAHELNFGNSNSVFGSHAGQGLNNASFNSIFGMEAGGLMFAVNYDGNAFFGYRAGASTQTGFNAFFGTEAGFSNGQGFSNSFFGTRSGFSVDDGINNAFFGDSTGLILGQSSFNFNNHNNTFVGSKAGRFYQSGNDNTLVGSQTGTSNEGAFNTYVGSQAGSGVFGFGNILHTTAIGYRAGFNNRDNFNTFVGSQSGMSGKGSGLTIIGSNSGKSIDGSDNVFVGDSVAIIMDQPGNFNTFIGSKSASQVQEGNENTAVGYKSMSSTFNPGTIVQNVTAVGAFAGQELQNANNSTFVGNKAGQFQFLGGDNVYVGSQSGMSNQNSSENTAVGTQSGMTMENSESNVAIGYMAGNNLDLSSNNVYIGKQAAANSNFSNNNIVIGSNTFTNINGLNESVAVGEAAGSLSSNGMGLTLIGKSTQSTTSTNATAIGHRAHVTTDNSLVLGSVSGENGAVSSVNVGVGTSAPTSRLHIVGSIRIEDGTQVAGRVLTTDALGNATWQANAGGSNNWGLAGNSATNPATNFIGTTDNQPLVFKINNTFAGTINQSKGLVTLGFLSGNVNTGNSNTFIGHASGDANTTGEDNTFMGSGSGGSNNTGSQNTFIGTSAGSLNTIGISNTITGYRAGFTNSTGNQNAFYGKFSGTQNTSGSDNSFYGTSSGLNNTSGNRNSYFGANAGSNSTTGVENTILGQAAGLDINSGSHNTFAGSSAGDNTTNGQGNTFIGDSSGTVNFSGSFNTLLGYKSNLSSPSFNNAIAIGHLSRVDAANSMVLGSVTGVNGATATVNVGIGVNAPAERLHVVGNIRMVDGNQAPGRFLRSDAFGTATWQNINAGDVNAWSLVGNSGTNISANFIGTTDFQPLAFRVNNTRAGLMDFSFNTFFGVFSGGINPTFTGTRNTAYGNLSGTALSALSSNNTLLGNETGMTFFSSDGNVGVGNKSLRNSTGNYLVAVGDSSLINTTGDRNTGVGSKSGILITTGTDNTMMGFQAGGLLGSNGSFNTVVGSNGSVFPPQLITLGSSNTLIGYNLLNSQSITGNNVMIGANSGAQGAFAILSNNTFVGTNSGVLVNTNNLTSANTALGFNAGINDAASTVVGSTAIGANAMVTAANSMVLGSVNGVNGAGATVNVGIGTTAPARRLHIVNAGASGVATSANTALAIESNASTYVHMVTPTASENGLLFGNPTGSVRSAILFNGNMNDGLDFRAGGNTTRMVISPAGNVGIGSLVPSERLDVSGNIAGDDYYASTTNGVINCGGGVLNPLINMISDAVVTPLNAGGDEDLYVQDVLELGGQGFKPGGGSWAAASDKRLKKDIVPYNDGLAQVLKINPVKFKYNDHFKTLNDGKEYIGVIAQEIKDVAPYTVELTRFGAQQSEDENGITHPVREGEEFYSYDSSSLTYMLINAIKEQHEMIKKQQEEIDELKKKMDLR